MKTYEQLMKHYWGVIVPMAEAAGINPWECVRHVNEDKFTDHPKFEGKPWNYTFALTVLDGKPVFIGDKLWSIATGEHEVITELTGILMLHGRNYMWAPLTKKRTFMLGGKELPCPMKLAPTTKDHFTYECSEGKFFFDNYQEYQLWDDYFTSQLILARDKE